MSAYIKLMTPMTDEQCLVAALTDVGFDRTKLEIHETQVNLEGYRGDQRDQTAHVVIRKQYVGVASNDIGFLRTATGYQAIVSAYDRGHYGTNWLSQVNVRYNEHFAAKQERAAAAERRRIEEQRKQVVEAQRQAVHERAKKMGYHVKETQEGDKIRMVLVKRAY